MNQRNNRRFHALLKEKNLSKQKAELVLGATGGRSSSSKDMTDLEVESLIESLGGLKYPISKSEKILDNAAKKKQLPKAFWLFRELGYYTESNKPDYDRINAFCLNRTSTKKVLDEMNNEELTKLINQLEKYRKK